MNDKKPTTDLHPQFSSGDATATPWMEACERLEKAELYWLATVHPNSHPHITPIVAIWLDDGLYFCTGATERKAKNLVGNPHCIIMTGCNTLSEGLDLVVEGEATRVNDETKLQRVADGYAVKYGPLFHFIVYEGNFLGDNGNVALVYEIVPTTAFGFGKGKSFSQTRWRF